MNNNNKDTRLIRTGHYVAAKFQQGFLFFNVLGTERVELKPFILLNENGNRAEIAAQTAGDADDRLLDPSDTPLVEPEDEDRNTFFHILYGIKPSRMQVFERYGRNRNESLIDYDEPGDPAPITDGFDSPYNNPTREAEMFVVNDMEQPKLQAYNPMDEAFEAVVSVHVTKLRYGVIEDLQTQRALLQGQLPCKFVMVGGGVQNSDQVKAPGWMMNTFGQEIRTANEILSPVEEGITGASGQGGNGGGSQQGGGPSLRVGEEAQFQ